MPITKGFFATIVVPIVIFLVSSCVPSLTVAEYIARVPVYLEGTKPRQLVRYKELPFKEVFKPPCVYPGALIEDPQSEWMCSLRCECIENGNIWCWKTCDHTRAELHGRKCLVSRNDTAGACCPKIQCDDKLKRKKLVSIKTAGTPPGVELFCERGAAMPLSFCSTFSMSGDKYDWGRIPSMARCGPGPMQCLEYYRDYAVDPAVNDSMRSYLYTSSLNSTTEEMREEVRESEADKGRERVIASTKKHNESDAASSSVQTEIISSNVADTSSSSDTSSAAAGTSNSSSVTMSSINVTTTRFRET